MKKVGILFFLVFLIPVKSIAKKGYIEFCDRTTSTLDLKAYYQKGQKGFDTITPSGNICKRYLWIDGKKGRLRSITIANSDDKNNSYLGSLLVKVKTTNNGVFASGKIGEKTVYNTLSILKYQTHNSLAVAGGHEFLHVDILFAGVNPVGSFKKSCKNILIDEKKDTLRTNCSTPDYYYPGSTVLFGIAALTQGLRSGIIPKTIDITNHNGSIRLNDNMPEMIPPGDYLKKCNAIYFSLKDQMLYAGCDIGNRQYTISGFYNKMHCANIKLNHHGSLYCVS